jgi:holo-[acyl-carrier protein] synthase
VIIGIGVDRVAVSRIDLLLSRFHTRLINRLFSAEEQTTAGLRIGQASYVAKRFAAKEAISKALGTGIGHYRFTDLMIFNDGDGKPFIRLSETAAEKLRKQIPPPYQGHWHISLVDEDNTAMAFVVLEARHGS